MMCGPDMTASGAEITVSRLEMIVAGFLIIISAAEISICVTEINISEPETIVGVPPIIVSGMKMSGSGPEMIIGLSAIMISLTETIVSLTDLTGGATAMTVSESSMGVDEREIIVNETGLIAFVGKTRAARRRIPMTPRVTAITNSRIASSADSWIFSAPTRSGHMEGSSVRKQQTRVFSVTGIKPFGRYLPEAGVRKQNIDVSELRFDFGVKAIQIFEMRHDPLDSDNILTDLRGRLVQFILAASGNDDVSVLFDETLGCFQTDAAIRTGDNCNLSSKSAHNTISFRKFSQRLKPPRLVRAPRNRCGSARPGSVAPNRNKRSAMRSPSTTHSS